MGGEGIQHVKGHGNASGGRGGREGGRGGGARGAAGGPRVARAGGGGACCRRCMIIADGINKDLFAFVR